MSAAVVSMPRSLLAKTPESEVERTGAEVNTTGVAGPEETRKIRPSRMKWPCCKIGSDRYLRTYGDAET